MERVTINLTDPASAAMLRAMDVTSETKTDTINHALLLYAIVREAMDKGGSVHIQADKDAKPERLLIL